MKINLTKKSIDSIPLPGSGQVLYYDTNLPGFGLRATKTAKTYFAEGYLSGKQKRVTVGRHGLFTPDQARESARQILAQLARGEDPTSKRASSGTLESAYKDMIAQRTGGQGEQIKAKTVAGYDWLMNTPLNDYKSTKLSSFTEAKVRAIHADLTKDRGPYAANNALRLIRNIFNYSIWAYADLKGTGNPVDCMEQLRLWNPETRRKRHIASDDLPDWIKKAEALDGIQRGAMLMMLFLGLRKDEVYCMKKSEIDAKGRCLVALDTKNGDDHYLPIGPYLWERLAPILKLEGEWLFPSASSKTGHIVDMRKAFDRLGIKASAHDLRRTFVSCLNALEPAPSAYTIKRLMNHRMSGNDVTAGYIQHEEKKLREVVTRLEAAMLRTPASQAP
jgi:integrase